MTKERRLAVTGAQPGGQLKQSGAVYVREAFLNPVNILALTASAGLSVVLLNPIPFLVAAGAEAAYLGTVPGIRRFRRMVDLRQYERRRMIGYRADAEIYKTLSPEQQAIVDVLKRLRDEIHGNYGRLGGSSRLLMSPSLVRVDNLISSFLRLMDQLNAYRRYLGTTDRDRVEREILELSAELQTESSERLHEIKTRRLGILNQRQVRFERARENREVISHQLAAIEDILRLIHEQSLTTRDPQDISRLLDTLAVEVEETEDTIRELESFLQLRAEVDEEMMPPPPGRD